MKKIEPYDSSELFVLAQHNNAISIDRILATYADEKNWTSAHNDLNGAHQWVWCGPVIVGYELAEWGLNKLKKEF